MEEIQLQVVTEEIDNALEGTVAALTSIFFVFLNEGFINKNSCFGKLFGCKEAE